MEKMEMKMVTIMAMEMVMVMKMKNVAMKKVAMKKVAMKKMVMVVEMANLPPSTVISPYLYRKVAVPGVCVD
jgi:hypothetical protein